jgi:DNA-binding NtrC family response regulator
MNRKHGCKVSDVSREVLELLQRYHWPGNVRELRNVVERAVILAGEGTLTPAHLPRDFGMSVGVKPPPATNEPDTVRLPVGTTVSEAEKALILLTLQHTKNNKTRAADILGISLKTLFNKLKEYGQQDQQDKDQSSSAGQ